MGKGPKPFDRPLKKVGNSKLYKQKIKCEVYHQSPGMLIVGKVIDFTRENELPIVEDSTGKRWISNNVIKILT